MTGDLPYNLEDNEERTKFNAIVEQWILDDDAIHSSFVQEWNDADDILNGDLIPAGWTEDHQGDLADKNTPTVRPGTTGKMFVNVPRSRPNHEAVIGDFITLRRIMNFTPRNNPKAANIAKILRSRVEFIEDTEQVNETVYFPAIDNAVSKGLWWIDVTYNPNAKMLKGKFDLEDVNLRDVLVDCRSRGYFFKKANRITRRMQFELEDAKKKFTKYALFDASLLGDDIDYDAPYRKTNDSTQRYATFYKVQFRIREQHYYQHDQQTDQLREIPEDYFVALSQNPLTAQTVFAGDEEMCYYTALYNRMVGVFSLQKNPFPMFTLIPVGNIFTDSRLYPIGDVKIYKGIQSLLNTLVTVFLENAKRTNKPVYDVDEAAYSEFQAQIDKAINEGGAIPGLKGVHQVQALNQALPQLISSCIGWIQDAASKHSASMGELPAKQIAKETVSALMAKDRQSQGRKDIMLNYALTTLATLLTQMICVYDTEPEFMALRNTHPGQPDFIPINQRWSESEYLAKLAEISGMEVPDESDQQATGQFEENLMKFKKQFEKDNDVRTTQVDGYTMGAQDYTVEEMGDLLKQSGMTNEEFAATYKPQPARFTVYLVNDLSQPIDLIVRYEIDQDFENDPQFRMNRALMLQGRGMLAKVETLKEMDIPEPEEKVAAADSEQGALQLAKQIASNPELLQAVQQLIQNAGMKK
jgi:hypothetical protein